MQITSVDGFFTHPLYHGTSSAYASYFRPGRRPAAWPHRDAALALLSDAWEFLARRRHEVPSAMADKLSWGMCEDTPWFVRSVLDQRSGGAANWRHGGFYVSLSRSTAVRYACGGARHGGELLTFCATSVDAVRSIAPEKADEIVRGADSLAQFLTGVDGPPLIVEIEGVMVEDLSTEIEGRSVTDALAFLDDAKLQDISRSRDHHLDMFGQAANFSLDRSRCIVARLYEVRVRDNCDVAQSWRLDELDRPGNRA